MLNLRKVPAQILHCFPGRDENTAQNYGYNLGLVVGGGGGRGGGRKERSKSRKEWESIDKKERYSGKTTCVGVLCRGQILGRN
jgi:hypothetical protein